MPNLIAKVRKLFPVNPSEIRIAYNILNAGRQPGLMIDVGAHYGESLYMFADSGWKVHAFEPDPDNLQELELRVAHNKNVIINSSAISNKNEEAVDFFKHETSTGASGLLAFQSKHVLAGKVHSITLDRYINENNIAAINLLKVDAEGYDLLVLKGILELNTIRPEMIICEFEDSKSTLLGYTFNDMAQYLQDHNYKLIVSEWYPIIEYGTQHYWKRFIEYPCELSDADAWGNILAVEDNTMFNRLRDECDKLRKRKKLCRMISGSGINKHVSKSIF